MESIPPSPSPTETEDSNKTNNTARDEVKVMTKSITISKPNHFHHHPFQIRLSPRGKISAFTPIPGCPPGLEPLMHQQQFLFQIQRNVSSLGTEVYKSYNVFLTNGTRIFIIGNYTTQELTSYKVLGYNGVIVMSFDKTIKEWGDDDFCFFCPAAHASDEIIVRFNGERIGSACIKGHRYRPFIFYGWNYLSCYSRYHVKYAVEYVGDNGVCRASTRRGADYGLEVIDPKGTLIGKISIANHSNWEVNSGPTPDFILSLTDAFVSLHPNGKAVLWALAIRHQLNVMLTHKRLPSEFKYMRGKSN